MGQRSQIYVKFESEKGKILIASRKESWVRVKFTAAVLGVLSAD